MPIDPRVILKFELMCNAYERMMTELEATTKRMNDLYEAIAEAAVSSEKEVKTNEVAETAQAEYVR